MFAIDEYKTVHLTRGDIAVIKVGAVDQDGSEHLFKAGDVVRLTVFESGRHDDVVLQKQVEVEVDAASVDISLDSADTALDGIINKPEDYWYELELNPDTAPQTIVGYDEDGPKVFRLYPEAV